MVHAYGPSGYPLATLSVVDELGRGRGQDDLNTASAVIPFRRYSLGLGCFWLAV